MSLLETVSVLWEPDQEKKMTNEEFVNYEPEAIEYMDLLAKLGFEEEDKDHAGLRSHRRFEFDHPEKTMLLQVDGETCSLIDISRGGLCFYSKSEYVPGMRVDCNFDGQFQVAMEIINVNVSDQASESGEAFLRHGAQFIHKGDGLKCTIAVLKYFLAIKDGRF